jgi:hypothetical protein
MLRITNVDSAVLQENSRSHLDDDTKERNKTNSTIQAKNSGSDQLLKLRHDCGVSQKETGIRISTEHSRGATTS